MYRQRILNDFTRQQCLKLGNVTPYKAFTSLVTTLSFLLSVFGCVCVRACMCAAKSDVELPDGKPGVYAECIFR